jgi:hypothetical protein
MSTELPTDRRVQYARQMLAEYRTGGPAAGGKAS